MSNPTTSNLAVKSRNTAARSLPRSNKLPLGVSYFTTYGELEKALCHVAGIYLEERYEPNGCIVIWKVSLSTYAEANLPKWEPIELGFMEHHRNRGWKKTLKFAYYRLVTYQTRHGK
jgi:hypothetical protein